MGATQRGVIYEGAFGHVNLQTGAAMTPDTVFWLLSMTKAITATACMQLVEQGKLRLDQPASEILPQLRSPQVLEGFDAAGQPKLRPARRPITVRHLLTHTAGFSYDTWDASTGRSARGMSMPHRSTGRVASPRTPLLFDPGDRWMYGVN